MAAIDKVQFPTMNELVPQKLVEDYERHKRIVATVKRRGWNDKFTYYNAFKDKKITRKVFNRNKFDRQKNRLQQAKSRLSTARAEAREFQNYLKKKQNQLAREYDRAQLNINTRMNEQKKAMQRDLQEWEREAKAQAQNIRNQKKILEAVENKWVTGS